MNKISELLCAHSILVFATLMSVGIFLIAGWLPPIDPGRDAADILAMFERDKLKIRIGMSVMAFASIFWWTFAGAVAQQMKRIEGQYHPLASIQLACASGSVLAVLFPAYFWLAMAYRPDAASPESVQLLNDFCWISFVGMYPPGFLQNIVIGACILLSKDQKIYPRWVGYANLWLALGFTPGVLLPFLQSGPFAWNGIIGFWLVATCFFGWIVLMWWATVRAIRNNP